jgi:hypothetical protein
MLRQSIRSVLCACCLALAACGRAPAALENDAYIWQRQWTPELVQAMRRSAADVRDWRVLAAQTDTQGRLRSFPLDRAALASSGRPVILVVRIDGQLVQWDEDALLAQILALRHGWPDGAIAGIEIDHDCGTARLPAYTHFLGRLKAGLGKLPLSITALPAWLESPALEGLLAQADETVLQVHAVQSPHAGLFDAALADAWARRFSTRTGKPFRIALPTYASRVSFDADGRQLGVESEVPNLAGGASFSELAASPEAVAAFVAGMSQRPPVHLAGLVWFRLPTGDDTRAWSVSTWHAVMRGLPLSSRLSVRVQPASAAGAVDLLLRNDGDIDASLPSTLRLPADCKLADGINGYVLVSDRNGLHLQRRQDGWLHAHRERAVGWARCADAHPRIGIQA